MAKAVDRSYLVAQLNNMHTALTTEYDGKYLQESALTDYAKTADVPTKTSDLNNDSNFVTATDMNTAISSAVASAYIYKGSVADSTALPTEDLVVGWVYNLEDSGMNVAWNGTEWDNLGMTFTVETETENIDFTTTPWS